MDTFLFAFVLLIGMLGKDMAVKLLEGTSQIREVKYTKTAGALLYLFGGWIWYQLIPLDQWKMIGWVVPWMLIALSEAIVLYHTKDGEFVHWFVGLTLAPLLVLTALSWWRVVANGASLYSDWRFSFVSWFTIYRATAILVVLLQEMHKQLCHLQQLRLGRFMVVETIFILGPWMALPTLFVAMYAPNQPLLYVVAVSIGLMVGAVLVFFNRLNTYILAQIAIHTAPTA